MINQPTVLITGVAGGIGSATAEVFRNSGWYVIGVDRATPSISVEIDRYIHSDISDLESNKQIFNDIEKHIGHLDALVNNAAIQVAKNLVDTEPNEWDMVMDSNVRAVYLSIKHAFPLLKKSSGSIVNVSSVHAVATSVGLAAYVASKGALLALTRATALELSTDNIRVNAVLPGAVDTHMLRAGLSRGHVVGEDIEARLESLGKKHVIGRVGQPAEIGEVIMFLCDKTKSSFVTGQSIIVDGGATARLSTE